MKSIVQRIILGIKKVLRKLFGKKIKIEKTRNLVSQGVRRYVQQVVNQ